MRRNTVPSLLVFIILFCFCATLRADVVELKSGKIVEGEITQETDQFIAIETSKGTSFFKVDEVKSVSKTPPEATTGKVVEVTGAVEVLPKGTEQWAPAQKDMVLNEGDKVRTGADSKAIAVFGDQAIVAMEPQSSIGLDKLQQTPKKGLSMKVNLEGGQLWNDVGKLKTKDSTFHVTTPAAVTGVRGTAFTVEATPDEKTTVAVVEGGVNVRNRELMEKPTRVKKDYMTEVSLHKPPTKPVAISAAFVAQWAVLAVKFAVIKGGMGAATGGISAGQAAAAGGGAAAAGGIAAALSGGEGKKKPHNTVTVTASESGSFSPSPIDTEINGSSAIGTATVTGVDVMLLCDPFAEPDTFQIIYEGVVIASTGPITGENIPLNVSATGSSPIVTIQVITGPLGTIWQWNAKVTYHITQLTQ